MHINIYGRIKMTYVSWSFTPWWRHQMDTFSALLAICEGNSPFPGEFPAQRPVTRIFDVLFDLRPNKQLSKQWWGWWFQTPSCSLWRHRNAMCAVNHSEYHNALESTPNRCRSNKYASDQYQIDNKFVGVFVTLGIALRWTPFEAALV